MLPRHYKGGLCYNYCEKSEESSPIEIWTNAKLSQLDDSTALPLTNPDLKKILVIYVLTLKKWDSVK